MKAVKATIIQFLILGAVGTAVGFTVNAVRAKNKVYLGENYFKDYSEQIKDIRHDRPNPQPSDTDDHRQTPNSTAENAGAGDQGSPSPSEPEITEEEQYGVHVVHFQDVVDAFENPSYPGAVVFLDARDDMEFKEGHIPGAFQLYPFKIAETRDLRPEYFDELLNSIRAAQKTIVYCNGGDCTDSKDLCDKLLVDFGIDYDLVYLYPGGIAEWKAKGMPVETGRDDK